MTAVAWLPVAPLDERIDSQLDERSPLRGAVAVALAQQLYAHGNRRFSGPRWRRLAADGAQPQRLGFSQLTGQRDLAYVERLALPGSLLALPPRMLAGPRDDRWRPPVEPDETEATWVLREAGARLRLQAIASELQSAMHERRSHAFHGALHAIADRLAPVYAAGGRFCL